MHVIFIIRLTATSNSISSRSQPSHDSSVHNPAVYSIRIKPTVITPCSAHDIPGSTAGCCRLRRSVGVPSRWTWIRSLGVVDDIRTLHSQFFPTTLYNTPVHGGCQRYGLQNNNRIASGSLIKGMIEREWLDIEVYLQKSKTRSLPPCKKIVLSEYGILASKLCKSNTTERRRWLTSVRNDCTSVATALHLRTYLRISTHSANVLMTVRCSISEVASSTEAALPVGDAAIEPFLADEIVAVCPWSVPEVPTVRLLLAYRVQKYVSVWCVGAINLMRDYCRNCEGEQGDE